MRSGAFRLVWASRYTSAVTNASDGDRKPNGSSITTTPCTCRYLQRASDEPAVPIVFDAKMNEYHLAHLDLDGTGRAGHSIIRYCPW